MALFYRVKETGETNVVVSKLNQSSVPEKKYLANGIILNATDADFT